VERGIGLSDNDSDGMRVLSARFCGKGEKKTVEWLLLEDLASYAAKLFCDVSKFERGLHVTRAN